MARRLREIEIRNNQEEKRARDKHIVIVLVNVGECTWACFGDCGKNKTLANMATEKMGWVVFTCNIDNEMRRSRQSHDLTPEGNW